MRRNPQPSAFVATPTADAGFYRAPGHQISFEDEPTRGRDAEQQRYLSWQTANGGRSSHAHSLSLSQEGLLDLNNNNNNHTYGRSHLTTTANGKRPAWQTQKLHRSCNNLTTADYGSAGSSGAGSNNSPEFHQTGLWRGSGDFAVDQEVHHARLYSGDQATSQATSHAAYQATSHGTPHAASHTTNGYCGIGNCGKVLWISRDREVPPDPYSEGPASRRSSTNSNYGAPPGVIVRTNAQGLPYTPSPHQRQAYLANQHAIEAAIPLVVNGGGGSANRRTS